MSKRTESQNLQQSNEAPLEPNKALRSNSTHLIALTLNSGLPIFTRKRGDGEQLSFSTIGSLYGIYTFGKSTNTILENTKTVDGKAVLWKEFADSVLLIICAANKNEEEMIKVLDVVYNAMILRVGLTEIKDPKNLERLKRELKNIYPLIDRILDSLNDVDKVNHPTDITGMLECALYEENQVLQAYLETHVENMASMYGCVLLHGRIAVATLSWWTLTPIERLLLAFVTQYETPSVARDIPVFLPDKSPEVPYRLVMSQLMPGVEICTLCGPSPAITEVEAIVNFTWKNCSEVLKGVVDFKSLPDNLVLDSNVMGLLLVNKEYEKYLLCNEPNTEAGSKSNGPPSVHRTNILKTFYKTMSPMLSTGVQKYIDADAQAGKSENESVIREPVEAFWSSEFYKCHAVTLGSNQLYALFPSMIPRHLTGVITRQTIQTLLSEKMFIW
ncbi:protein fuzzy homolog isoform X1 [Neocloeon triangulifer]|uniref:protein fuzzy homolog isoform X1 n=1 Tax=Neocloeon triangulifer TaxID=2078957 RepID=UPI00286F539D|nr:protein fuzzy homolog isoform X1 [Neocloeon triangulifer]XP_059471178.1 protein fuzzy homolog isoform X1 [Neocloeon triangulifer]